MRTRRRTGEPDAIALPTVKTQKFAQGERPYAERTLRLLNEVPALATIVIVLLVVVKPFVA